MSVRETEGGVSLSLSRQAENRTRETSDKK